MAPAGSKDFSAFDVSLSQHLAGSCVHGSRWLWTRLGDLESASLRNELSRVSIDRPVYIAGLARAGTTVLLEILAAHSDVVTHRYRDYLTVFTPYWWEQALLNLRVDDRRVERSHADGILVNANSPEAIEETLWMTFFQDCHNPAKTSVLDGRTRHPEFEQFYTDHIRKLLLARNGSRYASKGNYSITRLEYLLKLFPDARFIIPIRSPREHIASLQKQHRLLLEAGRKHPRSVSYLDRVGHFEFGCHRTPINAGGDETIRSIQQLWSTDTTDSIDEVRGWARYWSHLYGYLADRLLANPALREAVEIVRYEDLCSRPGESLRALTRHCELRDADQLASQFAANLQAPTYYQPGFNDAQEQVIIEETQSVASWFGYSPGKGTRRAVEDQRPLSQSLRVDNHSVTVRDVSEPGNQLTRDYLPSPRYC